MSDLENSNKKKSQSLIRWNAIIPFLIISVLVYLYFLLFFDLHMKKTIEWVGYKALGSEVNVGQFKSSFIKGNVQISKIELTNKENPNFNSLELADIRFDLNWDALLRVKFVIEDVSDPQQVEIMYNNCKQFLKKDGVAMLALKENPKAHQSIAVSRISSLIK